MTYEPDDEKAATAAIYQRISDWPESVDLRAEAAVLARVACEAARPKMWDRLHRQVEQLENQVMTLLSRT